MRRERQARPMAELAASSTGATAPEGNRKTGRTIGRQTNTEKG